MGTPAGEGGGGKDNNKGSSLTILDYHIVPFPSLSTSAILDARAIWWRQARLGYRLPAEPSVILISGGKDRGDAGLQTTFRPIGDLAATATAT